MMQKPPRPTGIAIIAILEILVGLLAAAGGALIVGVASSSVLNSYGVGMFSGIIAVIGGFAIIIGLFAIFVGWGMWTGKGWAWTLALVLYILGALFGILTLPIGIVGLVIDLLLIWYLYRPHVKAFFGKGGMTQQAPMAPSTTT
jgi:hypothetical protein